MRKLLAIALVFVSPLVYAGTPTQSAHATVQGKVLETKDVPTGYTYLLLKTDKGEQWAAVPTATVKKGDTVTLSDVSVMHGFKSRTLHKTFPTILFGRLGASGRVNPHGTMTASIQTSGPIHVAKAAGRDARTVAEVVTDAAALNGKTVTIRGKVVKYNPDIMGRNWVHLQDGSGSAAKRTNDILVTTHDRTSLGAVVTARGTVKTKQDFGAGYYYPVMIGDAKLTQ